MEKRTHNYPVWPKKHLGWMASFYIVLFIIIANGLAACIPNNPQQDATALVEQHLTAKQNNDYSAWQSTLWPAQKNEQNFTPTFEKPGDLGVLNLSIEEIAVSDEETERIRKQYSGSELAESYGWSDEFIGENMIAVFAKYTVDYDNTKVPYNEGTLSQYFYLVRENQDAIWLIWDASSPSD